jgi:multidrug efflux pump subunit AcrA (membrane-fusion protein)
MAKKLMLYFIPITLLSILFAIFLPLSDSAVPLQASYSEIQLTDLVDSITVKGTVESVNKSNVYTLLTLRTKEVNAQIGDRVEEGQVLCVLDTEDLALNIEQLKAELDMSQQSSLTQYEMNKTLYDEASRNLSGNTNAQIISASNALETARANLENAQSTYNNLYQDFADNNDYQVQTARLGLESAQKNYDAALKDYENNTDANVAAAESAAASAQLNLDATTSEYENNKILYENGVIAESVFRQSENLYNDALNKNNDAQMNLETVKSAQAKALEQLKGALDTALTNYNSVLSTQNRTLEQAKNALDAAQAAYDNASAAYESAGSSAELDLSRLEANLSTSEIALNQDAMLISIQRLEKQLDDSIIKAPASGTVTEVYAQEGAVATGLLFVIEDTENLRIISSVKEYDYTKVHVGTEVIIRSDSTGENEYMGVISGIAPAATKSALGEIAVNTDVEFRIMVDITSPETPLRIGMNARLELVMEKKTSIYRVRYDSIFEDEQGQSVIFAAEDAGSNTYKLRQVAVETGMSTDFYSEISSEELEDGLKVMNDANAIVLAIKKLNKTPDKINGVKFTFS